MKIKKVKMNGIATPATRSEHIKNLFWKSYIIEEKKAIKSTQKGRDLIALSPKNFNYTWYDCFMVWITKKRLKQEKLLKSNFWQA